jgi:hypothetical protein
MFFLVCDYLLSFVLSPTLVGIITQQSYVLACCVLQYHDYLFSCYVLLTTIVEKGR